MARERRGFADKFLSKIGKIDRRRLRDYIVQLLSRKDFFESIFNHLNEGIIVTDDELSILYSNPMARRMLLWPKDKLFQGEDLSERCPDGAVKEIWQSMRHRPRPLEQYECSIGPEGERRITLTAIRVEAPEPAGQGEEGTAEPATMWVFLLQDITDRYHSIEQHSRAQRLASLALLTSGVAHEIKNPLNSLHIHAQILLKEAEEAPKLEREKVRRATEVILEETERLTEIVDVFLQAARPQRPLLQRRSLNGVVDDLIRVFGPECESNGIELKTELDPDLPVMDIDSHLIFQAVRNLVRNAIEAHQNAAEPSGEVAAPEAPPRITVRTRLREDHALIEIEDNGPGIAEESVDKIFEPYYTTKFSGTGLGLMVVYRIVAQHGGALNVDSRPGQGTVFTISLPLAERPVRLLDEPEAAHAAESG